MELNLKLVEQCQVQGDHITMVFPPSVRCLPSKTSSCFIGETHLIDWEMCGTDYAADDIGWYFVGRTSKCLEQMIHQSNIRKQIYKGICICVFVLFFCSV